MSVAPKAAGSPSGSRRRCSRCRTTCSCASPRRRASCHAAVLRRTTSSSSSSVIGIGSLTVVVLTGFFTGAVLALQSGITLDQFGARPFVGRLISASMIKELGPVLTALMLAGRVGSGIAAELGSMVVTEQINALRALGTDPIRKLVVPRVLAGFIMSPILTVVANAVGLLGGWIIASTQLRVASGVYWTSVVDGLFIAGRLDGPDQAVLPRLRDRDDRLPRGLAHERRHPGRRPRDHQRGGRSLGRASSPWTSS